jgi:hypothetical protein
MKRQNDCKWYDGSFAVGKEAVGEKHLENEQQTPK